MSAPPITIIGAGIAGLVLGRALLNQGRRAILYQRGSPGPRFAYGITLYPWAYRRLLKVLKLDFPTFQKKLAVDAERGGTGRVDDTADSSDAPFRASRQKLEELLKDGLDIQYDYQVTGAEATLEGVTVTAEGKEPLTVPFLIDASGVHSKIRYALSKETDPIVLPYVVFNGKRRVKTAEFDKMYAPYLKDSSTIEQQLVNGTVLAISIAEVKDDLINLSYTYSRPSRNNDELHKPARALAGSEDIPDAFFIELQGLGELEEPFASMFKASRVKTDRVLHWLLRTTSVTLPEVQRLAEAGIVMVGDASHAHPIVKGEGANASMADGLELAEWIARRGTDDFSSFLASRHGSWNHGVRCSEQGLKAIHEVAYLRGESTL